MLFFSKLVSYMVEEKLLFVRCVKFLITKLVTDNKSPNPDAYLKGNIKVKYPCLICGGHHFTKECPDREEVNKFLKNSPTRSVLNTLSIHNNN